jgi:23S rRNA (uracil1939-C5)-methyltransferase
LIINGNSLPKVEKLIDRLTAIEGMKSISINQNTKKTNVILGDVTKCIWGDPYITDMIHLRDTKDFSLTDTAVAYHISPQSFYQVNPVQTEKLYSLALDYAGLTGKETVWDLYCGIGTISLFLAQKAGKVYGVEIVPQAIEDAKNNAALNGINNAEFFVGKAEEVLPAFYEKKKDTDADMLHPDVIVVDPPRKGCDGVCLETMLKMQPERIVYVSCDSATLARDLKMLCEGGYELCKVRAVDQFGNTTHVETVVLLSKGAKGPVDLCSARTEVERRLVDSRKVKVDFSLEDMDLSEFKGKATYEQIKAYVLEQTGLKVSSLYIAQIKKKCGLDVGENFNLAKSENTRQPQCTTGKEEAIMQAFSHFGIK